MTRYGLSWLHGLGYLYQLATALAMFSFMMVRIRILRETQWQADPLYIAVLFAGTVWLGGVSVSLNEEFATDPSIDRTKTETLIHLFLNFICISFIEGIGLREIESCDFFRRTPSVLSSRNTLFGHLANLIWFSLFFAVNWLLSLTVHGNSQAPIFRCFEARSGGVPIIAQVLLLLLLKLTTGGVFNLAIRHIVPQDSLSVLGYGDHVPL